MMVMMRVNIGLRRSFLGVSLCILRKRSVMRKVQVLLMRKADRNLCLVDLPLNSFVLPEENTDGSVVLIDFERGLLNADKMMLIEEEDEADGRGFSQSRD
jgi:hypothetical protein